MASQFRLEILSCSKFTPHIVSNTPRLFQILRWTATSFSKQPQPKNRWAWIADCNGLGWFPISLSQSFIANSLWCRLVNIDFAVCKFGFGAGIGISGSFLNIGFDRRERIGGRTSVWVWRRSGRMFGRTAIPGLVNSGLTNWAVGDFELVLWYFLLSPQCFVEHAFGTKPERRLDHV